MLKKEIMGTLKTKRSWIFILLIIIIPLIDLGMVCHSERVWYAREHKDEIMEMDRLLEETSKIDGYNWVSGWIIHPAKAAYLSGSSDGHLMQMLLIWLMPLFMLNIYSDRYISEYSRGYINSIYARTSRKKYIISKLIASFIISFIVFMISMIINFIAAQIIFKDGYNFNGMELFAENGGWFKFMYTNPNSAYLLYIFIASTVAGICGIICQCIAFISKKYTITYLITFFIWMAMIMMNDSITYLTQPFIEFGTDYMFRSATILIVVSIAAVVFVGGFGVKRDEL